jgi:hypothetical protein
MRAMRLFWFSVIVGGLMAVGAWGGEYRLANGNTLRGEIASADEDGLVVKLDVGGFSKREAWVNFSQETLRELAKEPKIANYVEPFIELTMEELHARETKKEIVIKEVPNRVEHLHPRPGMVAGFMTPIGLLMLAVLMLANLYAAYEIAVFRQRPVGVVCAVSLVLPGLGPLLFLGLPTGEAGAAGVEGVAEGPQVAGAGAAGRKTTSVVAPKPASGLSLAAMEKPAAASAHAQPQVYTRGENTFNRRFFETKFPGFFRVVPSEAERDLVIVIKTARNEYVGRRISRISMNELHLQLQSGNNEVNIPFGEISTVIIRHKDAKT